MKEVLLSVALFFILHSVSAQWNGNTTTTNAPIWRSGYVGIGMSGTPITTLQVLDPDNGGPSDTPLPNRGLLLSTVNTGGALYMGVDATSTFYSWIQSRSRSNTNVYALSLNPAGGKVGIGTTSPTSNLHIKSNGTNTVIIESTGSNVPRYAQLQFNDNGIVKGYVWVVPESKVMAIGKGSHEHISMRLDNDRVGIGTTSPDAKLTVNGDVHAKEVRVDLNVNGPDYVFEESYPLRSLSEIQQYIAQYKHLPEVPSAKQMEEDGINVGEMNMILLKKVEELTLYIIEQQKQLDQLKEILQNK